MLKSSFRLVVIVLGLWTMTAWAEEPQMGPRRPSRDTVLVDGGQAKCKIIFPGKSKVHADLARQIAAVIQGMTGCAPECVADTDSVEADRMTLKPDLKAIPIVLLGNINNNRAIITPYAAFRCAADARYPGGDGYVLWTISNPCGTGQNQILIGASTDEGAKRGVAAFLDVLKKASVTQGRLVCPHLLDVAPGPEFAEVLKDPGGPVGSTGKAARESVPNFAWSAVRYQWSGHIGWAQRARQYLLVMMATWPEYFPDMHYNFSELVRGWDMVEDSGVFSPEEVTAIDNHLLRTAIAHQSASWRQRRAVRTIGNRHPTAGTSAFHLLVMHLLRCNTANDAAKKLLLQWKKETEDNLHSVARHSHNPHDSATALDAISDTYWYCLENSDLEFFTSGAARGTVDYALMCWDNMGYAAGIDGYEAAVPGYVRTGRGIGLPLAVNAFFYQDGRYKRLLRTLPNPTFQDWFMPQIPGIHEYATGPELPEEEPGKLTGVTTLPLVRPRYEGVSQEPYDNITRGVTGTNLPYEKIVEKICFRTGFKADDQYLLLQAFQGSTDGTVDGNCIVRFCEAGHIFLFHSVSKTGGRTHHFKNGVSVGRGDNLKPIPAACSLDACADLPRWGFTSSTLPDCNGADWARHILWKKGRFFAVIDGVKFNENGEYAVSCNWRTPQHAAWDGAKWQTTHNGDAFVLRPAMGSSIRARREDLLHYGSQDGATAPWVLREQRHLAGKAGEVTSFANVFYVVRSGQEDMCSARAPHRHEVLFREGNEVSLLGAKSDEPTVLGTVKTDAALYVVSGKEIDVAQGRELAVGGQEIARADQPFDLELDLSKGAATVQSKGKVALLGKQVDGAATAPAAVQLPTGLAEQIARELSSLWDKTPAPSFDGVPGRPPLPLKTTWAFDGLKKSPIALPVVCVKSSVPAERGWPVETIVDTLLPSGEVAVWSLDKPVTFDFDLGKPEPIAEIRILTRTRLPELKAEVAFDAGSFAEAPVKIVDFEQNRYKGRGSPFRRCIIGVPKATAQTVRLRLTAPGRMALDEIEIGRQHDGAALVEHTCTARLGPTTHVILFATDQDDLVALDSHGKVVWRRDVEHPVSALAAFDVNGDGIDEIFIGMEDFNLLRLDAEGKEVWRASVLDKAGSECALAFSVSMAQLPGEPPKVIVGHYHYTSILDPDTGKVLDVQRTGGAYCRSATPPTKLGTDGPTACFLRNTWGAGVACAEPGPKLRSFNSLAGQTRLLDTFDLNGDGKPEIIEASDEGVRLCDLPSCNLLFSLSPFNPISAATVLPAQRQIVLAMADGFLLFIDAKGNIIRKTYLGETATGAAALGDRLLFATQDGLLVTDPEGKLLGTAPGLWLGVKTIPGEALCIAWTTKGNVAAFSP